MKEQPEIQEIIALASSLGRALNPEQARLLGLYLGQLVKWNGRMNLVGPSGWQEMLTTLIQDSWHLADFLAGLVPQPQDILDLGAGAGLPGIPLRVFWPQGRYHLVEPRQKRAIFMQQAVVAMKLPQTFVHCCRMEALPPARRAADLILSRAFMPWKNLLAETKCLLAPGGRIVIMSNQAAPDAEVDGYCLEALQEYAVIGKTRYFWLFALIGEDL